MKVTKNGVDIFEIEDNDDEIRTAASKGYVPAIDVTKDGVNFYTIKGTEDEITTALGKGYRTVQPEQKKQFSKTESAVRGGLAGASFDFDDEIGGAVKGIRDDMVALFTGKDANNGVKAEYDEKGNVTNADKLTGNYEKYRDEYRKEKREASDQNPWSYGLAEVAAGAALPIGAGGTAKTLTGAALKGAGAGAVSGGVSALGRSEAANAKDLAWDTAEGAVLGGALGGTLGVASNAIGRGLTKSGRTSLAEEIDSFFVGKEKPTDGSIVASAGGGALVRIKNGIKETLQAESKNKEMNDIAAAFRKTIGPGHFRDMSSPEVIVAMAEEGNTQAIDFIAKQVALTSGVDADDVRKLYTAGASKRVAARKFDFDAAGEDLATDIEGLSGSLKRAATNRGSELNELARSSYLMREADPTEAMEKLNALVRKGREHPGTVGNVSYIDTANEILENGSNSIRGLTKRHWTEIDDTEMYDRLQAAREYLGENVKFSNQQGLSKAARESQDAYHAIGKILKFDPDKMESDAVWTSYYKLQETLLDSIRHDGKIDKYKAGASLKDTVTAKRFRDNLELLNEFVERPGLPEDVRQQAMAFRSKFANYLDTADLKRAIQKFDKDTVGVSGMAVERASSLARKDDVLAEKIKAPSQGLKSSEQLIKLAEEYYQKPWDKMSMSERRAAVNYAAAVKRNPDMTFPEAAKIWGEIKNGK